MYNVIGISLKGHIEFHLINYISRITNKVKQCIIRMELITMSKTKGLKVDLCFRYHQEML